MVNVMVTVHFHLYQPSNCISCMCNQHFLDSLLVSPVIGIGDHFNGGHFGPTSYSTCATGAEANFMYDIIIPWPPIYTGSETDTHTH